MDCQRVPRQFFKFKSSLIPFQDLFLTSIKMYNCIIKNNQKLVLAMPKSFHHRPVSGEIKKMYKDDCKSLFGCCLKAIPEL